LALFHVSTNTPSKAEILATWIPTMPWGSSIRGEPEIIGSFHLDDPVGEVGLETHLVRTSDALLQVPLTYRSSPLAGVEPIAQMEHSVLGTRWVYDGIDDDCFLMVLCGLTLTGQGESLGWAHHEGRWFVAPTTIKLCHLGPRTTEPVAVDGLRLESDDGSSVTFGRGRLSLTLYRELRPALEGDSGLAADWPSNSAPVLLASAHLQPR
jgi:hypothetical protein